MYFWLIEFSLSLPPRMDGAGSRFTALHKLWSYCTSIVANSIIKWNIIITRLGKPSSAEIRGKLLSWHSDHTLMAMPPLLRLASGDL